MVAALAAIFVFLALSCGGLSLYVWRAGGRGVDARLRTLRSDATPTGPAARALLRRGPSAIPPLRDLLGASTWAHQAALELDRANVKLTVGEYFLMRVFLGVVLLAVPVLATRGEPVGLVIGVLLAVVGYMLPALYVGLRRRRRLHAIDRQLAEALTHIATSIRAGFAMLQALDATAQRLEAPLSEELSRLVADVRLGASLEDALVAMGERVGSYDLDMVITAILIQRSTGGNLSEILENVAETIRERDRIRGEIRTLTAQQRFASRVLSLWPILLALIFFLLNPELMSNLWTEPVGWVLLTIAGVLQVLGFLTIRRIVAIEI